MREIKNIKGFKKISKKYINKLIEEGLISKSHLSIYDLEIKDPRSQSRFMIKVDSIYAINRHSTPSICLFYKDVGLEPFANSKKDSCYEIDDYYTIKKENSYVMTVIAIEDIIGYHKYDNNVRSLMFVSSTIRYDREYMSKHKHMLKNYSSFEDAYVNMKDLDRIKEVCKHFIIYSKFKNISIDELSEDELRDMYKYMLSPIEELKKGVSDEFVRLLVMNIDKEYINGFQKSRNNCLLSEINGVIEFNSNEKLTQKEMEEIIDNWII